MTQAVRGLMANSTAMGYINGTVFRQAIFKIRGGIRQGCPTVRGLVASLHSPHDSLTFFADDLARSLVRLGRGCVAACLCPLKFCSRWASP